MGVSVAVLAEYALLISFGGVGGVFFIGYGVVKAISKTKQIYHNFFW
jgi:hypothetical protein